MSDAKNLKQVNKLKHEAEELMVELLHATTKQLLKRIKAGDASPQDIANAIRICKENDVDISIKNGQPLGVLDEDLPFAGEHLSAVK
jgi:hypothetical protein